MVVNDIAARLAEKLLWILQIQFFIGKDNEWITFVECMLKEFLLTSFVFEMKENYQSLLLSKFNL